MAAGLNKITVIGNLGKDPEMRYTQGGTAVCNMRIGVTERRKEGEDWKDHTEWFTIVSFGKTAENTSKFLKKGRQIYVEGRLQTKNWEDREGGKRTSVEIIANQILFLGNKEANESGFSAPSTMDYSSAPSSNTFNNGAANNGGANNGAANNGAANDDFLSDDDVPF